MLVLTPPISFLPAGFRMPQQSSWCHAWTWDIWLKEWFGAAACYKLGTLLGFPGGSDGKESTCNAGDLALIPGLGRSPGRGHGNPLQYFCLENPMDRGAWRATVHGVSRIRHDWATKHTGTLLNTFILKVKDSIIYLIKLQWGMRRLCK